MDLSKIQFSAENEKKFKEWSENLMNNSSLDNLCELIVEPLIKEKEVIFRIIDTKFREPSKTA